MEVQILKIMKRKNNKITKTEGKAIRECFFRRKSSELNMLHYEVNEALASAELEKTGLHDLILYGDIELGSLDDRDVIVLSQQYG